MKKFPNKCYQLSQTIQYYRLKRNLSQYQLAKKIKVQENLIKEIEVNFMSVDRLPMDIFFKIADALELDARALLEPASEEKFHQYKLEKDKP